MEIILDLTLIDSITFKGSFTTDLGGISLKKGQLITGLPNDIAYIAWIEGGIFIVVTSTTSHGPYKKRRLS